jgi:hypothetical protein
MADKKTSDSGEAEVQSNMDEINEQGFLGDRVDERPREDYTVAGSVKRQGENLETGGK